MIYFIQPEGGGPIKIGQSSDVPSRVRHLSMRFGRPLVILATMEGGRDEEAAMHERFGHLRLDGPSNKGVRPEQFRPGADLMAFLGMPELAVDDTETIAVMEPLRKEERTLADMFRHAMHERGVSSSELARRVGMSRQEIHHLVSGINRNPKMDKIEKLAAGIGISMGKLFAEPGPCWYCDHDAEESGEITTEES